MLGERSLDSAADEEPVRVAPRGAVRRSCCGAGDTDAALERDADAAIAVGDVWAEDASAAADTARLTELRPDLGLRHGQVATPAMLRCGTIAVEAPGANARTPSASATGNNSRSLWTVYTLTREVHAKLAKPGAFV